jgi:N-acylneuraminate cytidylyltransferase
MHEKLTPRMAYEDPEGTHALIEALHKVRVASGEIPFSREKAIAMHEGAPGYGGTLVHIPARSGSTRIRDKNIHLLGGLPLLAYTVLLAKALPNVDRVIVDTDSRRYAEIARHYGADTPYLRPSALAGEKAGLGEARRYLALYLDYVEQVQPRRLVTMLPTTVFRNVGNYAGLISRLDTCAHLSTAFAADADLSRICVPGEAGPVLLGGRDLSGPEKPRFLKGTGGLIGVNFYYKVKHGNSCCYHLVRNPVELVDIDTEQDLAVAEEVLSRGVYDFGMALPQKGA